MGEQNGRAELLRAGGFPDAAAFLEKIDAINTANAKRAEDEAAQPQPVPERQPSAAELQRRAEGEVLLRALRESGVVD